MNHLLWALVGQISQPSGLFFTYHDLIMLKKTLNEIEVLNEDS